MGVIHTIQVPLLAVNDTLLTIADINYRTGDFVRKGDVLMIFETSKTTYDVESGSEGYVEVLCEAGKDYEVNTIVAHIHDQPDFVRSSAISTGNASMDPQPAANRPRATSPWKETVWEGKPLFSNEALKLIQSAGLSVIEFKGYAFVSSMDVQTFLGIDKSLSLIQTLPSSGKKLSSSLVVPVDASKVVVTPFTKNKKMEIQFLGSVQSAGLTSTISTHIEIGGLFARLNPSLQYFKDALLPLIIYEVARLLGVYQELNAYYTEDGIAFYKETNVGFAVDMDKGLKVLKIPSASKKSLKEIETEIFALSERYLDDKITIDDLSDISFTITDLSAEGVSSFIPLVNYMNSAILGVGAIDSRLGRCTLSLTFDHRVTEGKLVARFLGELKERIESYAIQDVNEFAERIHCSNCFKTLSEDLSGLGFVKCLNHKGEENYVCQTCFKGF